MDKYIWYNGLKFTRDDFTGYYLNSTHRKRLHRYIWESDVGVIPKGYQVHHIDHDKNNNDISNLELIHQSRHMSYHGIFNAKNNYDEMIKNLDEVARPKASEWHGSKEGVEWHKKHYESVKHKLHIEYNRSCIVCEKEYVTIQTNSKFCSNACKSRYRRSMGLDNITKNCVICGKEFTSNKYAKVETCSASCRGSLINANRKINGTASIKRNK